MSRWVVPFGVCLLMVWAAHAAPTDTLWTVWSQHRTEAGLWWRPEAGPFGADACRAALKKATGVPRVGMTKWYNVTPEQVHAAFGQVTPPALGTWVACWPAGFDFDRDLVDR